MKLSTLERLLYDMYNNSPITKGIIHVNIPDKHVRQLEVQLKNDKRVISFSDLLNYKIDNNLVVNTGISRIAFKAKQGIVMISENEYDVTTFRVEKPFVNTQSNS